MAEEKGWVLTAWIFVLTTLPAFLMFMHSNKILSYVAWFFILHGLSNWITNWLACSSWEPSQLTLAPGPAQAEGHPYYYLNSWMDMMWYSTTSVDTWMFIAYIVVVSLFALAIVLVLMGRGKIKVMGMLTGEGIVAIILATIGAICGLIFLPDSKDRLLKCNDVEPYAYSAWYALYPMLSVGTGLAILMFQQGKPNFFNGLYQEGAANTFAQAGRSLRNMYGARRPYSRVAPYA